MKYAHLSGATVILAAAAVLIAWSNPAPAQHAARGACWQYATYFESDTTVYWHGPDQSVTLDPNQEPKGREEYRHRIYAKLGGDRNREPAALTTLDVLNLLGRQGWELAMQSDGVYVFKRRLD